MIAPFSRGVNRDRTGLAARKIAAVLAVTAAINLLAGAAAAQEPFWSGAAMDRESVLFVKDGDGPASAPLLFTPRKFISLTDSTGQTTFEEGKDFIFAPGNRVLTLTPNSRIPFKTRAELYPPQGSPQSIDGAVGGKSSLFWAEGHVFHDLQALASYEHDDRWTGYAPKFAAAELAGTIKKLKAHSPITLVVLGDSISQGYNASGYVGVKPGQGPYPDLVAKNLQDVYGSTVRLRNFSLAGTTSDWGLTNIDKVVAEKPDLVILAFGMNDAGGVPVERYAANLKQMMLAVRQAKADTEFILVATMTGNPQWTGAHPDVYPRYREALAKFVGPAVALANVTDVWTGLLAKKRFVDLTGNGVNHPNDFGHRIYAQVISGLLVEQNPKQKATTDSH